MENKLTKEKNNELGKFKINKITVISIVTLFLNDFDYINFKYTCKKFYNLDYDYSKRKEKCLIIRKVKILY